LIIESVCESEWEGYAMKNGDDTRLSSVKMYSALIAVLLLLTAYGLHPGSASIKGRTAKSFPVAKAFNNPQGMVIYVDQHASGANNGSSWADAYTSLQTALTAAVASNEIWVASGVYTPTLRTEAGDPRSVTFQLKNGVALYGGFAGGETSTEERNWEVNKTILSGDLNGDDSGFINNGENAYHVLRGSSLASDVILDGFTIQAGHANGSANADKEGGGLRLVMGSNPQMRNCIFKYNQAEWYGGGIVNYQGDFTLTEVIFSHNSASFGGGIQNFTGGDPVLHRVLFSENTASDGGGMANYTSGPHLVNVTFYKNSASQVGGGIENSNNSYASLVNVTFSENSAGFNGGGLYNNYSDQIVIVNNIFMGNASYGGGGMHNYYSNVAVVNSTLAHNSAAGYGGGVNNAYSNPSIANSIVWDNSGGQIANDANSTPVVSYSDVQGGYSGSGNIDDDPLFIDADGADNVTGTLDDNLRLWSNSPAIDAGSNSLVYTDTLDLDGDSNTSEKTPLDLDNKTRQVEMPLAGNTGSGSSPIVDMGAYEGRVLYVDQNACGTNSGASWMNAYGSVHDGLGVAASDNEIWVAQGSYLASGLERRTDSFSLVNNVALYGGFPSGGGDGSFSARDWQRYATLLSGDIGKPGEPADNTYHVVSATSVESGTILDGFTIAYGNADGTDPDDEGGGMLNDDSDVIIANCRFYGNLAASNGGGLANLNESEPQVINCAFSGNQAAHGAAIYNEVSSTAVTQATFSGNATFDGGVLHNYKSDASIANSIFWDNKGEAIYDDGFGTCAVSYSVVEGGYPGGTHILDQNPKFLRRADPGADDAWGSADDDYGDLRLGSGSPAIDAGDNDAIPADLTDMDGDGDKSGLIPYDLGCITRRMDIPWVTDTGAGFLPVVDMGAYEAGLETIYLPLVVK
jgi:hypothetical protein